MNDREHARKFKNSYFVLRHGESVPNTRGVILSDLEEGKKTDHTLTKNGEEQVLRSVHEAKQGGFLNSGTIIYASPFSRTRRTAEIAKEVLCVEAEIVLDERLRERWFGDWEGTGNANYQKVWDRDFVDADHNDANVESTAEVARRVAGLISDLEEAYSGKVILLVSHGDALQILQTFFEDQPSSLHRGIEHLKVAEVRQVG